MLLDMLIIKIKVYVQPFGLDPDSTGNPFVPELGTKDWNI